MNNENNKNTNANESEKEKEDINKNTNTNESEKEKEDINKKSNNNINNNNNIYNNMQFQNIMGNNFNNSNNMINNMNFLMMNNNFNYNQFFMNVNNNNMLNIPQPNLNNKIKADDGNITLNVHLDPQKVVQIKTPYTQKIGDLIIKIKKEYNIKKFFKLLINGKNLVTSMTIAEVGLENGAHIHVAFLQERNDEESGYTKAIHIKFLFNKSNEFSRKSGYNFTNFLSKLCFLKELSLKLSDELIGKFVENISCIFKILKYGKIDNVTKLSNNTKELLERIRDSNILNFAKFVDTQLDYLKIKSILNLLTKEEKLEFKTLRDHLFPLENEIISFQTEFYKARKESIFEFSVISLEIADRKELNQFEKDRKKNKKLETKILYHGETEENAHKILETTFNMPTNNKFGKGFQFSDSIDYSTKWCRFSIDNYLKIPEIGEKFSLVASSVYYNKECVRHVMDNSYDPKKQEINFSYVDGNFSPIKEAYKTKFSSKEYIVGNLEQIFPFINIKIQRNEYCVIWRDPNFSETPVYNDNYDKIFKQFLKQRKDYVEQYAKFNIYPCIDSDEALELVKKKKYNKIILMSNVGTDFGGKKFVDKARLIIGNDVIALFLAYKIEHITWIKDYKNALFSNDSSFYEQYLECFTNDEETTKQNILTLKNSIQDFYKVKFNFDDKFLEYPSFIEFGKYSELSF
jgi:hypothetical protein